jgi:hypothetical protein
VAQALAQKLLEVVDLFLPFGPLRLIQLYYFYYLVFKLLDLGMVVLLLLYDSLKTLL